MPALRPNPPRMITLVVAIAFAVVGLVLALPIEPAMAVIAPLTDAIGSYGVVLDREVGYLCLFVSSALLVVGSLLPGI